MSMGINIYSIDRVKKHKVFYEMVKTFTKEITNCGRLQTVVDLKPKQGQQAMTIHVCI